MQAIIEKLTDDFRIERIRSSSFGCTWHFHPEYELALTLNGHGYRIVGDHVAEIQPNDLVLVGANLPHTWQANVSRNCVETEIDAIVVHFRETILGSCRDFDSLRDLLRRSQMGLHVIGNTGRRVASSLKQLTSSSGVKAIVIFLAVLDVLSKSSECRPLCTVSFNADLNMDDERRINKICRFVYENLDRKISRGEVAVLANLSESGFSRYFKSRTGKTFTEFVNELRVRRACRLLLYTNRSITETAFECGFGSLSYFNRQFRKLKKRSPERYRQRFSK